MMLWRNKVIVTGQSLWIENFRRTMPLFGGKDIVYKIITFASSGTSRHVFSN